MLQIFTRLRSRMVSDANLNADVRRSLVETLYASPTSLTIGAIAGLSLSVAVAIMANDPIMTFMAVLICTVAILRIVSAIFFHRQLVRGVANPSRGWELAYELGAWVYAGMLGILALISLLRSDDAMIHTLTVSLAAGYAGGISGRNAGRVQIAVGQVCLALFPTVIGLWLEGHMGYRVLSGVLFIMIPGMAEISRTTHRIVLEALVGKQEKTQLANKFEKLARYDSLTGVENRMAMQMRLREMFESSRVVRDALAVIWLDLDRFKEINDSLGHIVGDQLLCHAAERLARALDGRGTVARFGGDEFVLLCPDVDHAAAREIADDVLEYFADPFDIAGHSLSVSASIGIAVAPQDGRDRDEIMQHADMALYHAKHNGRNQHATFTWGMKERFNRIHEIETGLRRAIDNGELSMRYQPIFDVNTGQVSCCEALIRWRHPVLGDISPGEFIPIAESIGMIGAVSEWVLSQACTAAANWPPHVRVAVNISPALLRSSDLPRTVIGCLLASGLSARRLELEVTESVFLEDNAQTSQILLELQKIGLRLALDDFGTGYSSLSYLRSYRFDTLKVDQSFMAGINSSREDRAVVRTIAFLAQELDMETVAEGIETREQLGYARDAGFTNVQGYLMCRPALPEEIIEMFAQNATMDSCITNQTRRNMLQHLGQIGETGSFNAYGAGFARRRDAS